MEKQQNQFIRKQLFVDPKVQGALIGRVILYWMVCLLTITMMLLCWRIVTGPARLFYLHFNDLWFFYGPAGDCFADIIAFSRRGCRSVEQSIRRAVVAAAACDAGVGERPNGPPDCLPRRRFLA